jgi:PhnB protein
MKAKVRPIPDGYHTATPYLIVHDAAQAIDYYKRGFGATEVMRFEHEGKIAHAEVQIGDSRVMLGDEVPAMGIKSARSIGGSPVGIHLYVDDVDRLVAQAVAAGGTVDRPVQDMFYGDRTGSVKDPFGIAWHVATHKEDVSMEELQRRAAAAMAQG